MRSRSPRGRAATAEGEPRDDGGRVKFRRWSIGRPRLDRRAILELDVEVTPFLGAQTREAGRMWRRRALRDLARSAHDLLRVEVEEELSGFRLPAALAVPRDDAPSIRVDAEAGGRPAPALAAGRAGPLRDLPGGDNTPHEATPPAHEDHVRGAA